MRTGTRRMWARRILRAGWLMAPILSFPNWLYRFLCVDKDKGKFDAGKTLCCTAFWAFVAFCIWGVQDSRRGHSPATPQQISAAIKDNTCMQQLMPVWQKHFNAPLTVYNLERGTDECKQAMDNFYLINSQKKAMAIK